MFVLRKSTQVGDFPLLTAVRLMHQDILVALLAAGADPSATDGVSALYKKNQRPEVAFKKHQILNLYASSVLLLFIITMTSYWLSLFLQFPFLPLFSVCLFCFLPVVAWNEVSWRLFFYSLSLSINAHAFSFHFFFFLSFFLHHHHHHHHHHHLHHRHHHYQWGVTALEMAHDMRLPAAEMLHQAVCRQVTLLTVLAQRRLHRPRLPPELMEYLFDEFCCPIIAREHSLQAWRHVWLLIWKGSMLGSH